MADPQEFNSLDELFRKTFDDLPDTPAPSGWDTPSPRVWDQVQVRLKPPRSGWSTQTILLVSSLAVTLMLGLYWALSSPTQQLPATPEPSGVVEQPVAAGPGEAENPEPSVASPEAAGNAADAAVTPPRSRVLPQQRATQTAPNDQLSTQVPNTTERLAEEPGRIRPSGSAPLPGSRPASPNTTVLREAEKWRRAPWAKPLAPLPGIWEPQYFQPVPESLKHLTPSGKQD